MRYLSRPTSILAVLATIYIHTANEKIDGKELAQYIRKTEMLSLNQRAFFETHLSSPFFFNIDRSIRAHLVSQSTNSSHKSLHHVCQLTYWCQLKISYHHSCLTLCYCSLPPHTANKKMPYFRCQFSSTTTRQR